MSGLQFKMSEVGVKARRRSHKGSKYDPIIDAFRSGRSSLVKVEVPRLSAGYVRLQLKKRIDARELGDEIGVSTVSGVAYLEKK